MQRRDLSWKVDKKKRIYKLIYKGEEILKVVPFDLYKIEWPDKVQSGDYYNLTRSKEHAVNLATEMLNKPTLDS